MYLITPPLEVIARQRQFNISYFGGKNNVRITPDLLLKFDLILTIGKTVQYGLVLGIPVYNYDHFGGDGYITLQNIDFESNYGFTGKPNYTY